MDSKARKRSQGIIVWPADERPRERLLRRGLHALTDAGLQGAGELIIPHGMADHATGFATVPLDEVLAVMH